MNDDHINRVIFWAGVVFVVGCLLTMAHIGGYK